MKYPRKIFINKEKELVIISEKFYSEDRKNRIFVQDLRTFRILHISDNFCEKVNYVSFHPTNPVLAIGIGGYDGGYFFKGNLFLWNYELNKIEKIFTNSIEVLKCEFNEDGNRLMFTITPECDDLPERLLLIKKYQIEYPMPKKIDIRNLVPLEEIPFLDEVYWHNKDNIFLDNTISKELELK